MANTPIARAFHGLRDHVSVLKLEGQLRYPHAHALRRLADDLLAEEQIETVLLDLRGVELIDSTVLGVLARMGRANLERRGRRAIVVCAPGEVATCLLSSALDTLFAMVDDYTFEPSVSLVEVPIEPPKGVLEAKLGQLMLEAHRDLSAVNPRNSQAFQDVISALESELRGR